VDIDFSGSGDAGLEGIPLLRQTRFSETESSTLAASSMIRRRDLVKVHESGNQLKSRKV
jgi:hypothetical protein